MKLNFTQMENQTEHDLVWYFNHAEADMGIKSNWSAMVSASHFGGSTNYYDHTNSFILNSVSHYRELEKIFRSLSKENQLILFASFADVPIKESVLKIFKKFSGTAYYLASKELEELCDKMRTNKLSQDDKVKLSKIRIEATNKYSDAIKSYIENKVSFNRGRK